MAIEIIKILLPLVGLALGYFFFNDKEKLKSTLGSFVFNWLLPYVVFVEIASMQIISGWWNYSLIGAGFVLLPFFLAQLFFGLSKHQSALVATAEGGSLGFVVYATIGGEPLSHFFLVDMVGNGLSVFLIVFPILAWGKVGRNHTYIRLMVAITAGLLACFSGIHPLTVAPIAFAEKYLVMLLVLSVSSVVGASLVLKTSIEILKSKLFLGFWLYRLGAMVALFYLKAPLAVIILCILPPSFFLPILMRQQDETEMAEYTASFIASCMPIFLLLSVLFVAW
jgi:hypothetical protein